MGSLEGHVLPGMAFMLLGLWHLLNHIKLYSLRPNSYTSSPWFPTTKLRYLELYFIMVGTSISVSMELFIGPEKHHPFDVDGTIPSNHLRNFEHSLISMSFFVYAALALLIDKMGRLNKAQYYYCGLITQLVGAIAFGQQFLVFHLHSTDHKGLEGQYHLLLEVVVLVCLATTLMGIGLPTSFLVSFVRSLGIFFQGVWLVVMGFMLWTPGLIPKGCSLRNEDGHKIVRCAGEEALHRAKSLVNILFCWFVILNTVFGISFYFAMVETYTKNANYSPLAKENIEEIDEESKDNGESEQKNHQLGEAKSFIPVERGFATFDMER